jgi:hypothetical protein
MRPASTHSPGKGQEALGSRTERDIIRALLALTGLAALWWAGGWWWRAAHAEAVPPPRPAAVEAEQLPAPPRFDRRRALASMVARLHPPTGDAGADEAAPPRAATTPSAVSFGVEQGHGSESWSRSATPERRDFEPRYSPDAGIFAEPPPVAPEATRAFH